MDEARDVHLMPTRRDLVPQFKLQKRCCNHVVGHIFAVGGLTTSGVLFFQKNQGVKQIVGSCLIFGCF